MNTATFFVLCGIVLAKKCFAEQSKETSIPLAGNVANEVTDQSKEAVKSYIANTANKITDRPTEAITSNIEDVTNEVTKEEFKIINLCTDIPFEYNKIIHRYMNLPAQSSEDDEKLRLCIENLKKETGTLTQHINKYADSVSETDPDISAVQESMTSAVNDLMQSFDKMIADISSEEKSQEVSQETDADGMNDKIKFVQNSVKPAIIKFEESCLAQSKDILQNVLNNS